jgi:hypothetical protein
MLQFCIHVLLLYVTEVQVSDTTGDASKATAENNN